MSFLVYDEFPEKVVRHSSTPLSEWETPRVMRAYGIHVANQAYLEFMSKNGNWGERYQARKELLICDRKLTFWRRHPSWRQQDADGIHERVRKEWAR